MTFNSRVLFDKFLIIILILSSGVPYVTDSILLIPIFVIFFLLFLLRKKTYQIKFIIFVSLLFFIVLMQTYIFNFLVMQTQVGLFLKILIAYTIVRLVGDKFISYYTNIMYIVSIVSLSIYIPISLFPSLGHIMLNNIVPLFDIFNISGSIHPTMILYNFSYLESLRNAGPFWEPGAFAGYLLLAFMFNFYLVEKNKTRKSMVFFIAIVTTLSTTAYLAVLVFFFFAYYKQVRNVLLKIIVIFVILASGYYAFFNFDFIGKKIENQLSAAQYADVYGKDTNTQRFFNILRDMEDIKGHEIFGRGVHPYTRYSYDPENQIRTVGLTDIIVKFGIPFFLLMMYFMYHSICLYFMQQNQRNIFNCVGFFVTILIILMSEVYFNFPLFWSLLFLQFVYKNPKKIKMKLGVR